MNHEIQKDKIHLKPMITLFKAHKSFLEFIKNDIKNYNFDLNEFSVIEVIYHKKKISVSNIKEKILLANSSLSYILNKLEKRSLIKREKDLLDQRVYFISLTNEGNALCNQIFPKHYNTLQEVIDVLSNEEKILLSNLLKKLGKHVEVKNDL